MALIAHYKLNGDSTDSTNNVDETNQLIHYDFEDGEGATLTDAEGNYDGTISGASWDSSGKSGDCLDFNGSSDYVSTSYEPDNSKKFTLSAWVYVDGTPSSAECILGSGNAAGSGGIGLYTYYGGSAKFYVYGPTGGMEHTLTSDGWVNIVITYDPASGGAWNLYVNNVLQDTGTGTFSDTNGLLHLGRFGQYAGQYFDGKIDEVRIWQDKVLDTDEITSVYYDKLNGSDTDITYTTGKLNQAASFNGSSSKISLGSTINLDSKDNFSYGAWVYLDSFKSGTDREDQRMIVGARHGDADTLSIQDGGQVLFRADDTEVITTEAISLATWTHVFVTYEYSAGGGTATIKIYINGDLKKTSTFGEDVFPSGTRWIGYESRFSNYWDGLIDDVRIYDETLSADMVNAIYNSGSGSEATIGVWKSPTLDLSLHNENETTEWGKLTWVETNTDDEDEAYVRVDILDSSSTILQSNLSGTLVGGEYKEINLNNYLNVKGVDLKIRFNLYEISKNPQVSSIDIT